jgi:hypothetical protein
MSLCQEGVETGGRSAEVSRPARMQTVGSNVAFGYCLTAISWFACRRDCPALDDNSIAVVRFSVRANALHEQNLFD